MAWRDLERLSRKPTEPGAVYQRPSPIPGYRCANDDRPQRGRTPGSETSCSSPYLARFGQCRNSHQCCGSQPCVGNTVSSVPSTITRSICQLVGDLASATRVERRNHARIRRPLTRGGCHSLPAKRASASKRDRTRLGERTQLQVRGAPSWLASPRWSLQRMPHLAPYFYRRLGGAVGGGGKQVSRSRA